MINILTGPEIHSVCEFWMEEKKKIQLLLWELFPNVFTALKLVNILYKCLNSFLSCIFLWCTDTFDTVLSVDSVRTFNSIAIFWLTFNYLCAFFNTYFDVLNVLLDFNILMQIFSSYCCFIYMLTINDVLLQYVIYKILNIFLKTF